MFFISVFYVISQDAFAQNETQKINVYEGLGIKINYFDPWKIGDKEDEPSCVIQCFIRLEIPDFYASIFIRQDKFDSPAITNECKCDILLEYAKYKYENTIIRLYEDLVFINDNQTTISDGNIPAIQLEYETSFIGVEYTHLTIYTKSNNSFYDISFSESTNKSKPYPKYLGDFKKILNSLEFVSANEIKQKQPSFMMDTNESNNTSPIRNLANENVPDLSNNGKQQLGESLDSNNKIDITSHNTYINSIGHIHVIGEVENNSPLIAELVKIIGTFYDDNGNVVGTSFTYADPTDIGSGEKAPFDLILSDSTIPIEQIKDYRLTISYR